MRLLSQLPNRNAAGVDHPSTTTHHDPAAGIVHVAVGRSVRKTLALLQWTIRHFNCKALELIHVHQPSSMVSTPLGKLPADQANEIVVAEHRRLEKKEIEKILQIYQKFCCTAQVQPKLLIDESVHVEKGIIDLITRHGIQKLVMGAASDNCFKVNNRLGKVGYIAKNAPPFCEILFIRKGRHFWTREASEDIDALIHLHGLYGTILGERIWPTSLENCCNKFILDTQYTRMGSSTETRMQEGQSRDPCEPGKAEEVSTASDACSASEINAMGSIYLANTESCLSLASEEIPTPERFSKMHDTEGFNIQLQKVMMEAEMSKKEALEKRAKCKELEADTAEAINTVKALEAASAKEAKVREELQDLLRRTRMEQEELVCNLNGVMRELENARSIIAVLNDQAKEITHHCKEAAGELERMQISVQNLQLERQKLMQQQREEPVPQHRWRCGNNDRFLERNKHFGFVNDSTNFVEFSASDLQTATCDFSESFKLVQGSYGCVYKGEMLNRTVVIKKLHLQNMQGQKEFDQEVSVLSRLRHPHLVSLIGSCSGLLALVYEYLPIGPLHRCLFRRTTTSPLNWKIRTRIAAQISSALLFLHSVIPKRIIHGDLKPGNIYLDSDFNCKIGNFGVCHFVPEDRGDYPLFHRNTQPNGAVPYTDPECQRTAVLTPKSDVYSFGIIILQLLTGKPPVGLASEVRQAVFADNLLSILDKTAGEWPLDVARKLAMFGLQCSEMNSLLRPDLTPTVVRELEQLYLIEELPVPSSFLCPILQEIMHDPHVAADGFSYEGSAFREWIENGRGTSPMTNLKLDHLNLTPNHALRFAIQDWLCQSCRS